MISVKLFKKISPADNLAPLATWISLKASSALTEKVAKQNSEIKSDKTHHGRVEMFCKLPK